MFFFVSFVCSYMKSFITVIWRLPQVPSPQPSTRSWENSSPLIAFLAKQPAGEISREFIGADTKGGRLKRGEMIELSFIRRCVLCARLCSHFDAISVIRSRTPSLGCLAQKNMMHYDGPWMGGLLSVFWKSGGLLFLIHFICSKNWM